MIIEKNKNTFEDLLGLEIETEDKFLNKKLNSNICYLGGGGGGGQKQQDIAPTLRPFVTDVLERAKAEFTQDELAQFPGERVVGFDDEELAAQQGILGLVDRGISSDKRLSSADTYYDPALGLLKRSGRYTDKGASEITADEIQSRMNPYTQAVLDIAKRKAADEGALYRQQLASQAARTGGFGGSRQAILEAKAASDLGGRLSEIQTKGLEAAYNDAIRAAEAQRGRQFQAAAGLGALSGQFGNLGQQALGQAYREQGYRSGVGEAQRGLEQQRADIAYQTFVEGRDFPARQLERYAGIAFGVPQGYLQQPGPASPSAFQQFTGGAATVGGLGRGLGFFKEGGDIGKGGLSTVYRQSAGLISPLDQEVRRKKAEEILKSGINPTTKKPLTDTEKQNLRNTVESAESQITKGIKDITGLTDLGGSKSSLVDPELAADIQQRSLSILQKDLYDAEQRKKDLEQDKGFALAQAGLGILAADPSRGALAAIGEGAQPALQTLAGIQQEIRDLPAKEQAAELAKLTSISDLLENLGDIDFSNVYTLDVGSGSSIGDFETIAKQLKGGDLNSNEKKLMNSAVNDARALAQRIARTSPTLSQENTAYNNLEQEIFKRYFSSLALTKDEQDLNKEIDERTVFKEPDLSFEDFQNQYGNISPTK